MRSIEGWSCLLIVKRGCEGGNEEEGRKGMRKRI